MSDWAEDRRRYKGAAWLLQPAWWAVLIYRFGRWTFDAPRLVAPLAHAVSFLGYTVVRLVVGIDIPRTAQIGPGLLIHHYGGITIHPQAVVGSQLTLRQGVTIGSQHDGGPVPQLGSHVTLGAYAQVLGGITIGDHATVGALSLVIRSVDAGATVGGVPARELRKDD